MELLPGNDLAEGGVPIERVALIARRLLRPALPVGLRCWRKGFERFERGRKIKLAVGIAGLDLA